MARPKNPDPTDVVGFRVPIRLIEYIRTGAAQRGKEPGAFLASVLERAQAGDRLIADARSGTGARTALRPVPGGRAPLNRREVDPIPKAGK